MDDRKTGKESHMKFTLGKKYRDRATGFEATATARAEYLNGNARVCLTKIDDKGALIETWFDEDRLTEPTEASKPAV